MARCAVLIVLVYLLGAGAMSVVRPDVVDDTVREVHLMAREAIADGCHVVRRTKTLLSQPHQTVERYEHLLREFGRNRELRKSQAQRLSPQRSKTIGQSSGGVPLQSS